MPLSPNGLMAALIAVAGALSAVFSNDIVCLAMTAVVALLCMQRGLNPVPFLVGLACAANIGSVATLIGNPQNMLIGSVLQLHFGSYLRLALPPLALSLARKSGIEIDWRAHARIGVPVTLGTLALVWGWLRWAI